MSEVEQKLLQLAQNNPEGFTKTNFAEAMPGMDFKAILPAINSLLQQQKLDMLSLKNGSVMWRLKKPQAQISKATNLDHNESVVYQVIANAGTEGIRFIVIRTQTQIPQNNLKKLLNTMEKRNLIKTVKSVQHRRQKVYMLYELEPDESVSGGTWHHQQSFDQHAVDVVKNEARKYLEGKLVKAEQDHEVAGAHAYASVQEVHAYIDKLNLLKLTPANVEEILNVLIYEGLAQSMTSLGGGGDASDGGTCKVYCYRKQLSSAFTDNPCGICPLVSDCRPGGYINPTDCTYMTDWLF